MAGGGSKTGEAGAKPSTEDHIRRLSGRMLRKKLFVVLSTAKRGSDLKPHLASHLEYMIALEKKGGLFASGAFSASARGSPVRGKPSRGPPTLEKARTIRAGDPFVVNGLRPFGIREWTLNEGSLG